MMLLVPSLLLAAVQATPVGAEPDRGQLRELIQDCNAHSFQRVVSAVVDGSLKRSKMKLCGVTGQSDSDWIRTLRDSAAKIAANDSVPKPMRDEMVKALNTEITMRSVTLGSGKPAALSSDFTLRPRAAAPAPSTGNTFAGYTVLPPIPPPVEGAATVSLKQTEFVPAAEVPDLAIECLEPGNFASDRCFELDRHTMLAVRAKAPIAAGVALRMMRRGEDRGQISLMPMRKGQIAHFELPSDVCRGLANSQVEIQIMVPPVKSGAAPRVARSEGPFVVHC